MAGTVIPYADNAETYVHFSSQEYEDQLTPEARFVKGMRNRPVGFSCPNRTFAIDLDRFEMASQGPPGIQELVQITDCQV